jgi:integrase/recombinase XerD
MDDGIDLFPSERGSLVAEDTLLRRFRRYCNDLDLPPGLDLHSLRRRLFITDAIVHGMPPHIAQLVAGHRDINTTMGYKNPQELHLMGAFPLVAC